ncbi:MAG: hypothetical protein ETSY1_20700 [Candidatus Entotheonella factor]|uniref:SWIM-type domain-containing protein n=1 Tax=Entotheonella factor TaxID=1429438 RepID=W4LIN1_ENTF1|nr:hypothetical protein [Candidatus Entotheonella palauensis]ETW97963.1 MAG: hypothetical protein ETSY1_20700 [Candidatus Entotheonella factor]
MRYYDMYPPYVPVAERRAKAERKINQLRKKNPKIKPVIIEGRNLAKTWWGKSWNSNLERYADHGNRIGRGRSYVRNRAVIDLQIKAGQIAASVQGSRTQPYKITIKVDQLSAKNWQTIREACTGAFDSLRDLLAGQFPESLKDLFFQKGAGLFPSPKEIHFDCSCPDWAYMCKHIAATLYGVGARLDEDPSLFFTLRRIDVDDLITETVADTAQALIDKAEQQSGNILDDVDLGDMFGIQIDDLETPLPDLPAVAPKPSTAKKKVTRTKAKTASATRSTTRAVKRQPAKAKIATATARKAPPPQVVAPAPAPLPPPGTMLADLVKAMGRARKGKSVDQLQDKLGWTRMQVRNTITRASAKGFIETVKPGLYRRVL